MPLSCGLVGLPNVGKSSLFNALTHSQCSAANFPFCTLEPNQGQVLVADPRLQAIAEWVRPRAIIPETLHITDIAGLIQGASKGEGLGNQFLAHIREVDAILHVVRAFQTPGIHHVAGEVNPLADWEVVELELMLADLDSLEKWIAKSGASKQLRTPDGQRRIEGWKFLAEGLSQGRPARELLKSEEEKAFFKNPPLLTAKPMLVVVNANHPEELTPDFKSALDSITRAKGCEWMALSVSEEVDWASLSDAERAELYPPSEWPVSKLPALMQACMRLLNLHSYFTAGVQEVRAWSFPAGFKAPQAAGVIHSDFERGFIRAEVIHYDDFIAYRGELGAKAAGKLRLEGKDYAVQDGDIIHFRFNV